MAERGSDRLGLCLKTAVLSVCSLCLLMFFSFPQCRLIIDPAGSVGPSGTGCDSDWKLVLGSAWLQPGPDTQLGGTPSVWSCLFPRVRRLLRSSVGIVVHIRRPTSLSLSAWVLGCPAAFRASAVSSSRDYSISYSAFSPCSCIFRVLRMFASWPEFFLSAGYGDCGQFFRT